MEIRERYYLELEKLSVVAVAISVSWLGQVTPAMAVTFSSTQVRQLSQLLPEVMLY